MRKQIAFKLVQNKTIFGALDKAYKKAMRTDEEVVGDFVSKLKEVGTVSEVMLWALLENDIPVFKLAISRTENKSMLSKALKIANKSGNIEVKEIMKKRCISLGVR